MIIDDYKNGYGLDDETYEILLERLYGYEEYYYNMVSVTSVTVI